MQGGNHQGEEVENTKEFRAIYEEYFRAVERYVETAQTTRQAFIRLLLTLSSGSLVASVSLLQSWVTADTVWLALLPVAWGLFGISVLACLAHYASFPGYDWVGSALKIFIDDAEELTRDSRLSAQERVAAAMKIRLEQLEDNHNLKNESKTARVALASFNLGLLALIVFATRNLPWSL